MKTTILSKNYQGPGEKLREIIEKKLAKLDRYFDDAAVCTIVCSAVGKNEKMEITINAKNQTFRAQGESSTMYKNIDLALEKIERQIVKNKERLRTVLKKEAVETKKYEFLRGVPKFVTPEVMKRKSFAIKTLTAEEAELALETIDHAFFVYADKVTSRINVMYRRPDGHVGIIEIENAKISK